MKHILALSFLFATQLFAGELQILGDNFQFTEGPAADAKGNLYFTDIRNNRIHKVPTTGKHQPPCNALLRFQLQLEGFTLPYLLFFLAAFVNVK